jgi:DNA repair exonuclease SbcCD ATPase subunit
MLEFLSRRSRPASKGDAPEMIDGEEEEIVFDDGDLGDLLDQPETLEASLEAAPSDGELDDLMNSIKQQSIEISCEFAAFANWSAQIETLSSRAATLQPLLKNLVEKSSRQATDLVEVSRKKDSADRRISELKTEVEHYRPLAARFEDELRIAKEKYSQSQTLLASLEAQFGQAQGYSNELMHKLSAAESKALRVTEENIASKQKALEHNTMIQSLLREVANLKSAIAVATSDVERQEQEIGTLSEKLAMEKESSSQAAASMAQIQMREARAEKDFKLRLSELEEQQQDLIQKLAIRDKQVYEAEIRNAAISSKVEFLTQLNQRLREDLRGHIDHSNMMEVSNRQLLEAMSHRRLHDDDFDADSKTPKSGKPKLRAVQVAE